LIGEEVTAINGVVEMLPARIAFPLQVLGGINSALRAHGMRALHGDDGKKIHMPADFGNLDDGGKARQATAHHNDSWSCCHDFLGALTY
jgi:hypothetical protein